MNTTIIVAGGIGLRMGTNYPKQFLLVDNKPLLMHTIDRFIQFDPHMEVILALPKEYVDEWNKLCCEYGYLYAGKLVLGGITRYQSVKNALDVATGELIAVHDGVRPLVSLKVIESCFRSASKDGSAIPILPMNESLRIKHAEDSEPVDRSLYFIVQTPQVFRSDILKRAYDTIPNGEQYTDDASLVQAFGENIQLIDGNRENIKITYQQDLIYAGLCLKQMLKNE